jgi:hypothetical protein
MGREPRGRPFSVTEIGCGSFRSGPHWPMQLKNVRDMLVVGAAARDDH